MGQMTGLSGDQTVKMMGQSDAVTWWNSHMMGQMMGLSDGQTVKMMSQSDAVT